MKKCFLLCFSLILLQCIRANNLNYSIKKIKLPFKFTISITEIKPLNTDCTQRVCRTMNVSPQTVGASGGYISYTNTTSGSFQCCATITASTCEAATIAASVLSQSCANQLSTTLNH